MRDDEVINFIAKLGFVRRALHILEALRGIHTQNKFRIDIHVAESGPYEETVRRLKRQESDILKLLFHKIGEDPLKRVRVDVETGLCLSIIRDSAQKLMGGMRARENIDESEQLKRVVKEVEKLIEMIKKKASGK